MKRPRLSKVEPIADYQLKLSFINGETLTVDKQEAIFTKLGLAPLRDPAVFAKARIVPGEGWTVEWEGFDIQIGADTLWLEGKQQAIMNEFFGMHQDLGISNVEDECRAIRKGRRSSFFANQRLIA